MDAQAKILQAGASVAALANIAGKAVSEFSSDSEEKDSGIDAKMAAKARKTAQMKIKAIQANKELSEKARTRRIGKVLDEYIGGNK